MCTSYYRSLTHSSTILYTLRFFVVVVGVICVVSPPERRERECCNLFMYNAHQVAANEININKHVFSAHSPNVQDFTAPVLWDIEA